MTDQRIIDKIQKLIAMAESPAIEEARTSAHMACKLILKHGLKVGAEQTVSGTGRSFTERYDPVHEQARQYRSRRYQQATNAQVALKMNTLYGGICYKCSTRINPGDLCYYWPSIKKISCCPNCA